MNGDAHGKGRWRWARWGLARLALGAATTVLVAWICAAWLPVGGWGPVRNVGWQAELHADQEAAQLGLPPARPQSTDGSAFWEAAGGIGWMDAYETTAEKTWHGLEQRMLPEARRAGWPFFALESRVDEVEEYRGIPSPIRWQLPMGEILRRGVPTHEMLGLYDESRLGLIPLAPGFLADAMFYGGIWALLIGGVRAIGRWRGLEATGERRRWGRWILLWLLAGLGTTVILAWACAWVAPTVGPWGTRYNSEEGYQVDDDSWVAKADLPDVAGQRAGQPLFWQEEYGGFGWMRAQSGTWAERKAGAYPLLPPEVRWAGWPFYALGSHATVESPYRGLVRPMFPGLALDVIFYAALWAAGIAGVRWVWRIILGRRRGFEVLVDGGARADAGR